MRFIVDQPVSPMLVEWLRSAGHDAMHVRERGLSRAPDVEIVAHAAEEDRIIITSDLDYSRLVALSRRDRPAVILFRAGNISDVEMLHLLQRVLDEVPPDRLPLSFVIVEAFRIRITSLPLPSDDSG